MSGQNDPFILRRFACAKEAIYDAVLKELRSGQKRTHWMWYIFPQITGLGYSPTSQRYAIKSQAEARHYLSHPILGERLLECAETILRIQGRSVSQIFGSPDDLKLRSSMTLFASITPPESVFARVLDRYFQGQPDSRTLDILKKLGEASSG
jgi:uncharacterized protein (DUF1810 family)